MELEEGAVFGPESIYSANNRRVHNRCKIVEAVIHEIVNPGSLLLENE